MCSSDLPLDSKNSTFFVNGDDATLGSLRKLTALLMRSSFIAGMYCNDYLWGSGFDRGEGRAVCSIGAAQDSAAGLEMVDLVSVILSLAFCPARSSTLPPPTLFS